MSDPTAGAAMGVGMDTAVVSAVSSTRSGSVAVRATEAGLPIDIAIDRGELRYGGAALATIIVEHCVRATASARAQRRSILADDGVPCEILDRLGLPTRTQVAASANDDLADDHAPSSWLKQV